MAKREFLKLVVVSPRDTSAECDLVFRVADELNDGIAAERDLHLDVWRWTKAYPDLNLDGSQGHLDKLMKIEEASLVIGLFSKFYGTVLPDGYSGTEHELRRAIAAWEQTGRPPVMVYFNTDTEAPAPDNPEENEKRIAAFRAFVSEKGLYGNYRGSEDFENKLRRDLTQWLRDQPHHPSQPPRSAIFDPTPLFPDAMPRSSSADLRRALKTKPVVTLEGLSGVGKTYVASSTCAEAAQTGDYRFIWWHYPEQNETVDSLFTHLGSESLAGYGSTAARSRALMHHLSAAGGLLVIDNFDRVDPSSYAPLVAAARSVAAPARLLLLSKEITDVALGVPDALILEGFDEHELKEYLVRRGISKLSRRTLTALRSKTGGLPFAASTFASLVARGYSPDTLLAGTMPWKERLKGWFAKILESLTSDSIALLCRLSVGERAFHHRTVQHIGQALSLSDTDSAFDALQRAYLVQIFAVSRWRVHALVSMLAVENMSNEERRRAHAMFARYYASGFQRRPARLLDNVEYLHKALAVRHFQRAGEMTAAQRLIADIARSAKARGTYEELILLIEPHLSIPGHDRWLDYHYAHCCHILGRIGSATRIAGQIDTTAARPELRLSVARVQAEILRAKDDPQHALDILTRELALVGQTTVHGTALAQARSLAAQLMVETGRDEEAEAICGQLLTSANERNDPVASAVTLTILGQIAKYRRRYEDAEGRLSTALGIFRDCEDQRGRSWAATELALVKADLHRPEAAGTLREALSVKARIADCSPDYVIRLSEARKRPEFKTQLPMIDAEIARVRKALQSSQ